MYTHTRRPLTVTLTAQRSAVSKMQVLMRMIGMHQGGKSVVSGISLAWVTSTMSLCLALPLVAARSSAAAFVCTLIIPLMYVFVYPQVAFSGCFGWARASSDVLMADVDVLELDLRQSLELLHPLAHAIPDAAAARLKPPHRGDLVLAVTEDGHLHPSVPKIGRHVDVHD